MDDFDLLCRYMAMVMNEEGIDFLDRVGEPGNPGFNADEMARLGKAQQFADEWMEAQ